MTKFATNTQNIHLEIFFLFKYSHIKQWSCLKKFIGYNLYQQREVSSGYEMCCADVARVSLALRTFQDTSK